MPRSAFVNQLLNLFSVRDRGTLTHRQCPLPHVHRLAKHNRVYNKRSHDDLHQIILAQCARSIKQPTVQFPHQWYSSRIAQTWLRLSLASSRAVICTLNVLQLDICRLALSSHWLSVHLEPFQPCVRIIKPAGAAGLSGAHLSELKFPLGSSPCWCICGLKQPIISPCLCQ